MLYARDWFNKYAPDRVYSEDNKVAGGYGFMNKIAQYIKENRRAAGLTQEGFALRSGLGLRFIRELDRAKQPFAWIR